MMPLRTLAVALLLACCSVLASSAPATRSGGEIMQRFHAGLADDDCGKASSRWRTHYARAAERLADEDEVALALFGYVLDEVREAGLPSEFALIPFVESRYRADARSKGGPAGLWQFTASTARRHGLRVQGRVDERLSVVASTEAAVRYLSRLHRMFGRDWRQTVMAYNAGEGALRASRRKGAARLSGITRSYPVKLHAIACLFDQHADNPRWQRAVERPVPRLASRRLPVGNRDLRAWAGSQGLDAALVIALNPGWHPGARDALAPIGAQAGRTAPDEAN
jgi:membrane-bound lytic murein transglycosylase D